MPTVGTSFTDGSRSRVADEAGRAFDFLARLEIGDAGGGGDPRRWYLALRPGRRHLNALAERVAWELILELEELGRLPSSEPCSSSPGGPRLLNNRLRRVRNHLERPARRPALSEWGMVQ